MLVTGEVRALGFASGYLMMPIHLTWAFYAHPLQLDLTPLHLADQGDVKGEHSHKSGVRGLRATLCHASSYTVLDRMESHGGEVELNLDMANRLVRRFPTAVQKTNSARNFQSYFDPPLIEQCWARGY